MKKLFLLLLPIATLLFYFSCQQLPTGPVEPVNTGTLFHVGETLEKDLIAGQKIIIVLDLEEQHEDFHLVHQQRNT